MFKLPVKLSRSSLKSLHFKNLNKLIFFLVRNYSEETKIKTNPYQVLGVKKNATVDEIRTAYIKESTKYHQLIGGGEKKTTEKYIQVQNSYREIIEKMHETGILVRKDDRNLMPYDFTIKPIEIENLPDTSKYIQFKVIIALIVVALSFYFFKDRSENEVKELLTQEPTEQELVEDIRRRITKQRKEDMEIRELREGLSKNLAHLK